MNRQKRRRLYRIKRAAELDAAHGPVTQVPPTPDEPEIEERRHWYERGKQIGATFLGTRSDK